MVAEALRSWQPVTTSRPAPATLLQAYTRGRRARLRRRWCRCTCRRRCPGPSSRRCWRPRSRRCRPRWSTPGRSAWASGSPCVSAAIAAAEGRPADEVARAARDRGRRVVRGLLRRHPRVPAPRRPDRRRGRHARLGAGREAVAAPGRRPHRAAGEGAHLGQGDRPPRGGRGRQGGDRDGRRRRPPPGECGPRRGAGRPAPRAGCPGWRTCTSARSAPWSARTSGRACSPWSSRRADGSASAVVHRSAVLLGRPPVASAAPRAGPAFLASRGEHATRAAPTAGPERRRRVPAAGQAAARHPTPPLVAGCRSDRSRPSPVVAGSATDPAAGPVGPGPARGRSGWRSSCWSPCSWPCCWSGRPSPRPRRRRCCAAAVPAPPTPAAGGREPDGGDRRRLREVVVHVVGAVHRPGLVRLPAGSRVSDAVAAAGGTTGGGAGGERQPGAGAGRRRAARGPVPRRPAGRRSAGGSCRQPGQCRRDAGPAGPVDLNTATLEALDGLPGIGPVLAQRILDWRAAHGRFSTVDELGEVSGIGEATLADLRPAVTV